MSRLLFRRLIGLRDSICSSEASYVLLRPYFPESFLRDYTGVDKFIGKTPVVRRCWLYSYPIDLISVSLVNPELSVSIPQRVSLKA